MVKKWYVVHFVGTLLLYFFVNTVHSSASDKQNVLFSTNNIKIGDRSTVRGCIFSNKLIELGIESSQYGDVACAGNVTLLDRSRIYGSVEYKGSITIATGSSIEGVNTIQNIGEQTLSTKTFTNSGSTINVWSGNTYSLLPGNYNEVNVYGGATLKLVDGTYNLTKLNFYPNSKADITLGTGVTVNVKSNFSFGDNCNVIYSGYSNTTRVQVYTNQTTQVYIGCGSKFNMTLTAPFSEIYVGSRAAVKGRLEGKNITIAPDTKIEYLEDTRFVDSDYDNIPDVIETELGSNPNNPYNKPNIIAPLTWGVSPALATKDIPVSYSTPDGLTYEVVFPKGSVTSTYYPYIEVLKSLPTGDSIIIPSDEKINAIYNVHGQISPGSKIPFILPFDDKNKNIGANSISIYEQGDSGWKKIDNSYPTSPLLAITFLDQLHLKILTLKDNVLLVDAASTAISPDGKSWVTAFPTIQQALAISERGTQIWLAPGVYQPGNDPNSSFEINVGVTLMGGFTTKNTYYFERDPEKNVTTLSGEIGTASQLDNTQHIIKCISTDANFDGLKIIGGYTRDISNGAGMHIDGNDKRIIITNCTFENNVAVIGTLPQPPGSGNGGGGAIYARCGTLIVNNCKFINNATNGCGGAINFECPSYCYINNSYFTTNSSETGGAIYLVNYGLQQPIIRNCVFSGNYNTGSLRYGGAFYGNGKMKFHNCTLVNNSNGDAWGCGGALYLENFQGTFTNCILWNNGRPGYSVWGLEVCYAGGRECIFSHCDVEGGVNGVKFRSPVTDDGTNISTLPLFNDINDVDGPDNKLGTEDDGLALKRNSPCFNAGISIPTDVPPGWENIGDDIPHRFWQWVALNVNYTTDITEKGNDRSTDNVNSAFKPDIGAYWLYLSEFSTIPTIDFLPHKDHPYGFDRILGPHTGYPLEERPRLKAEEIYMSTAFAGQGPGAPNTGIFRLVIDPRQTTSGKIMVANPTSSTCVIKLKGAGGTLVDELSFNDEKNIINIEIETKVKPASITEHYILNELQVVNSSGTTLRTLKVVICDQNVRNVKFYRVYDSRQPSTIPQFPGSLTEIEEKVNNIYSQAVGKFNFTGNVNLDLPFDANGNGCLDYYMYYSKSSYPPPLKGLPDEQIHPEETVINKAVPQPKTILYVSNNEIYNWFILPSPITGNPPKTDEDVIWVYAADEKYGAAEGGWGIAGRSDLYIGNSGNTTTSENIKVKLIEPYSTIRPPYYPDNVPDEYRIFKVTLTPDTKLKHDHETSFKTAGVAGETVWFKKSPAIGGWSIRGTNLTFQIKLYCSEYYAIAHELGHGAFNFYHTIGPDVRNGNPLWLSNGDIYKQNLMFNNGGVFLYYREHKNVVDDWFSEWMAINQYREP